MAKVYGGRWRTLEKLGGGGQSEVFRVEDTTKELDGQFALKRVLNLTRRARFRAEVEAIKRLQHPNVITLIDHSALDDPALENRSKQYLVTPIAAEGDLSRPSRLSLYPQSLDGILIVTEQLASALAAAHAAGIVHRDVKPQNILFTGNGHELWLADFGICLIREFDRSTKTGEAVGPRSFIAPELEDGGNLDVPDSVDVYSLGKVIFYMLSGGSVPPRESIDDPRWIPLFAASERHRLLRRLLLRMVCPVSERITMADVAAEIARLKAWEEIARELPVSPATLAGLDRLRDQGDERMRTLAANAEARERERAVLAAVVETIDIWLDRVLATLAAISTDGVELRIDAATGEDPYISAGRDGSVVVLARRQFILRMGGERFGREHVLRFYLGVHRRMRLEFGDRVAEAPVVDQTLSFVPYYLQRNRDQPDRAPTLSGFLTGSDWLRPGVPPGRASAVIQQSRVTREFMPPLSLRREFKVSQWPAVEGDLRSCVDEAVSLLLEYVEAGANVVG